MKVTIVMTLTEESDHWTTERPAQRKPEGRHVHHIRHHRWDPTRGPYRRSICGNPSQGMTGRLPHGHTRSMHRFWYWASSSSAQMDLRPLQPVQHLGDFV
jgi:hypothetical protein